jgi:thiamine-phosphate diphosphorylase
MEGIYVITDEELFPGRTHVDIAGAALEGGASVIQLRDKRASEEYLVQVGREIRRLTAAAGALFIVNDYLEIALACDADGLHIGQDDRAAGELRALLPDKILGVSAATAAEAEQALRDGADYLGVGPVFGTATKADAGPAIGVEHVLAVRAAAGLPVVAIGGIGEANIAKLASSGIESAAVISAVVCAADMVEATRRLVHLWRSARA